MTKLDMLTHEEDKASDTINLTNAEPMALSDNRWRSGTVSQITGGGEILLVTHPVDQ